LIILENEITD